MAQEKVGKASARGSAAERKDVYDWLADAPELRDSFLFALLGPQSRYMDEAQKRDALAGYTRADVEMAYEMGFC